MTVVYNCSECGESRIAEIEDYDFTDDKAGERSTCPKCEAVYEFRRKLYVHRMDLEELNSIGQPRAKTPHNIVLPCCNQESTVFVTENISREIVFVDCGECKKTWFAQKVSHSKWHYDDITIPPLAGDVHFAECPGCNRSLSFQKNLEGPGYEHLQRVLSFCPTCKTVFRVIHSFDLERIDVPYSEVQIPFGCPDDICRGQDVAVVNMPVGGGTGIYRCDHCKKGWQVTENGQAWVDLPVRSYRTKIAITDCHECETAMSYYTYFFANDEVNAYCMKCGVSRRVG